MHRRIFRVGWLVLVTLSLLVPVVPVYAAPLQDDEVVVGDDVTLSPREHVDGDLVVLGGDLTMQPGSRVEGSVTVLGGRAQINGIIRGDLVALGGDVSLGEQARVTGDTVAIGGRVHREPGAQTGDVVEGPAIQNIQPWRWLRLPFFSPGLEMRPESTLGSTLLALFTAVGLAILGALIVSFWPSQTTQVGETLVKAPLPSLGVGCLAFPLALSLTFFVLITVCLAPFAPVVVLALVAGSLFGWVALGKLFGGWLARTTGWRSATPLSATTAGVFVMTIVATIFGAVPCLGGLMVIGAVSIGVGAVTLSRFGTSPPRRVVAAPSTET